MLLGEVWADRLYQQVGKGFRITGLPGFDETLDRAELGQAHAEGVPDAGIMEQRGNQTDARPGGH